MKSVVLMGLCIHLVSGYKAKNEGDFVQRCFYNEVCLPIHNCAISKPFTYKPEFGWPWSMKICNSEQIGEKLVR